MIKHRDRLFQEKKDDPSNFYIKDTYKLFRNHITREIKKAKKEYFKQFFEDNLNNMKKTWQGIKTFINLNNNSSNSINSFCKGNILFIRQMLKRKQIFSTDFTKIRLFRFFNIFILGVVNSIIFHMIPIVT